MIILGADLSPTSSGLVKFILDEDMKILDIHKLGFCAYTVPKKKEFKVPDYKDIISYEKEKYDFFNRTIMMDEYIFDFIKGVDYAIIEDYAFSGNGDVIQLAEFCSQVKFQLLRQGTKIRLISPLQVKQFAGNGKHEKPDMEDEFNKLDVQKIDVSYLPEIPIHKRGKFVGLRDRSGISPRSDLIDSYWMVTLLYNELLVKTHTIDVECLSEKYRHVLTHTTPKNKIPLIRRDFIQKNV